jgi:hypothetical protein
VIIFGSVRFLSKKLTKPKYFFEKKPKPNRPVSVRFGFLGQKPVWLGFSGFGSVFSGFGSVFPVWLGFDSVFFLFFVGFGSVRFFKFFAYKTEPNRPVF